MNDEHRENADFYLDQVLTAVRRGAFWRPRDLLDPWFAFEIGNSDGAKGGFLTSGGKPHTFNNPCAYTHWRRLRHPHFWVSPAAEAVLARGERKDTAVRKSDRSMRKKSGEDDDSTVRLSVDHAVPLAWIETELKDESLWTREALRDFLFHHFRRGVILKLEDDRLNKTRVNGISLQDDMPPGWRRGGNPFARYEAMDPPLQRHRYDHAF